MENELDNRTENGYDNQYDNQYDTHTDGSNEEMAFVTAVATQGSDESVAMATETPQSHLQHQPLGASPDASPTIDSSAQNTITVSPQHGVASPHPQPPRSMVTTASSTPSVDSYAHHGDMQTDSGGSSGEAQYVHPQYTDSNHSAGVATAAPVANPPLTYAQQSVGTATPTTTSATPTPSPTVQPVDTAHISPQPHIAPAQPSPPTAQPTMDAAHALYQYNGQPAQPVQPAPPVYQAQPPYSHQLTTASQPSVQKNRNGNNSGLNNHKVAFAIIGSGLFLTIIICIGIFLYYPTAPTTDAPTARTPQTTENIDSIGLLQDGQPIPTIPSTLPQNIVSAIDAQLEAAIAEQNQSLLNTPSTADAPTAPSTTAPHPDATATRTPQPVAAPQTRRIISQRQPGVTTAQNIKPNATTAPNATSGTQTTPTRSVQPAAPTPATLYWIQVVSAKNRDSVEQAHVLLSEHQINGVVSKISDERGTFYRLRVGPFANYQEANKFNDWFSTTTTFSNSFIVTVKNS